MEERIHSKKNQVLRKRPALRRSAVGATLAAAAALFAVVAVVSSRPRGVAVSGSVVPLADRPTIGSTVSASRSPFRREVTAENDEVHLALAEFDDGSARYYSYRTGDKTVAFFVLRSSDGVIRAAFDACDVCYAARKGYRQEGDVMVCNNCGQRFPSVRINVELGGCNPSPLARTIRGSSIAIAAADLRQGARYF